MDGAETDTGWTYSPASGGFHVTTGTETKSYFNAYVAENRQYLGFDRAPVGFDYGRQVAVQLRRPHRPELGGAVPVPGRRAGLVLEHAVPDNNVGDHPGEG